MSKTMTFRVINTGAREREEILKFVRRRIGKCDAVDGYGYQELRAVELFVETRIKRFNARPGGLWKKGAK